MKTSTSETNPIETKFYAAGDALFQASKAKSRTAAHEQIYGNAYQALVRAGLAPQLRGKYRQGLK